MHAALRFRYFILALLLGFALVVPGAGAQQDAPGSSPVGQATPADGPASLPLRRDEGVFTTTTLVRVGAALILGAVLVLMAAAALRRFRWQPQDGRGRRINILEARRATPQLTLVLVRIDDRELLVGQAGDSVTLLESMPAGAGGGPGRSSHD